MFMMFIFILFGLLTVLECVKLYHFKPTEACVGSLPGVDISIKCLSRFFHDYEPAFIWLQDYIATNDYMSECLIYPNHCLKSIYSSEYVALLAARTSKLVSS